MRIHKLPGKLLTVLRAFAIVRDGGEGQAGGPSPQCAISRAVSRHQMKTLSLPLVSACCYNICLLLASTVIRQHKGPKSDDVLPACIRCTYVPYRASARETAVTIIMHKTVGEALPCQNIFIAIPLPAPISLPPCSLRRPRSVSHLCYPFIRLLPTCISGELYARERSEKRIAHLLFLFLLFRSLSPPIFLPLRFIAHARARVHSRDELRAYSGTHLHFGKLNIKS